MPEIWLNSAAIPWNWVIACLHIGLASWAIVHAMIYKRDPRAALGWVGISLFFPLAGPLMYYMFGINRIQTQARKLSERHPSRLRIGYERGTVPDKPATPARNLPSRLVEFARISDRISARPLLDGNAVKVLQNGEQAYPAMLKAIDSATYRVWMLTYLFEFDTVGESFVEALATARRRGVDVRVIVDGVGDLYSWPRISRVLHRRNICMARFLPPKLLPPEFSVNLRNHRKILLVDNDYGFTGGMNIGKRHLAQSFAADRTVDLHFQLSGPVVVQLEELFIEDWLFATGETIAPLPIPHPSPAGTEYCRCITDGPNDDMDKISMVLMGAISAARHQVVIVTPYFLPSREFIASLQSAVLRGVNVSIILPKRSNLPVVDWATRNLLWELVQYDVKVYYQPAPFAHTKLMVVDGVYAQIGSANIDSRSLRLNFELNLEICSFNLPARLANYAETIRQSATEVTLDEVDKRSLPTRLRDAICWMFMPYL
jgi:cardiolipin synthase A/B